MKIIQSLILLAGLSRLGSTLAAEPAGGAATAAEAIKPAATNAPGPNGLTTEASAIAAAGDNGTNGLRLNFRGVPLDMVLNYLSEAAGFIINIKPGTSARGKVDVWSNQSLTREEALNLLDTVLN